MQSQATNGGGVNPIDINAEGLCLLSLDGGGVRGLSSLYILKQIMDRVNHDRRRSNLDAVKPCEIFDLIGGTSTGGLIAIMLGRLEMDVDECISAYVTLMRNVFEHQTSKAPINFRGNVKPRFDSAKLQEAITTVIKDRGLSETDLLDDKKEHGCKVFVCATAHESRGITRLRSYSIVEEPGISATICEAALATSAATSFFTPVTIGTRKFVDGALGANNPVVEVESEASNIWCPTDKNLKPLVKCFISIGTGNPGKKPIRDNNVFKFFSETLVGISTQTERTEEEFIDRWAGHFDEDRYFRFNVDQGLQGVDLAEYEAQGTIETVTTEYIRHQRQKSSMRSCVSNLKQKENYTRLTFAADFREYEHEALARKLQDSSISVHRHFPFGPNSGFVGREKELSRLEECLFPEVQSGNVVIFGLGGVGKTRLAMEVVHRTQATRPQCSIFWIPATNVETLERTYTQIVQDLRLPGWNKPNADAKRLLQNHLCGGKAGQWLLIFDNADDDAMWFGKTQRLKDYIPWNSAGSVLFTTRFKKIANLAMQDNVIELPNEDRRMAEQLLRKRLPSEFLSDEHVNYELLRQLAFLPLAIVQATSYIRENSATVSEYLSLLSTPKTEVIRLWSKEFEDDWHNSHAHPVATTWLISFEQIQIKSPLAADILSFMACIHRTRIPESLLMSVASKIEFFEAIGVLKAYSFVRQITQDNPSEDATMFDLHRLVHLMMWKWLQSKGTLSHWTTETLERMCDIFPSFEHTNRSLWNAYMPHALLIIQRSNPTHSNKGHRLLCKVCDCLIVDNRLREAIRWLRKQSYWESRNLAEDDHDRRQSQCVLIEAYRRNGQGAKAIKVAQRMVKLDETLGEDHPNLLASQDELAASYSSECQNDKAAKLLQHVVTVRGRTLAEDDPHLLLSQHELAHTYQENGQTDKALNLIQHVVTVRGRTLAEDDPYLLSSQHELACTYRADGQIGKALKLFQHVVTAAERILAEDHTDLLASQHALAIVYMEDGQMNKALELLQHVVRVEQTLAEDHPSRLISQYELALAYETNGQIDKAMKLLQHVVTVTERTLSPEDPRRLARKRALARVQKTYKERKGHSSDFLRSEKSGKQWWRRLKPGKQRRGQHS